jgi:hypothetical protein
MPRGGPGSAAKLRLPANWPRTEQFLVWSWFEGSWWRVGKAASLAEAQADAAQRLTNVTLGTRGNAQRGMVPIRARTGARFVATTRNGNPQLAWEAAH